MSINATIENGKGKSVGKSGQELLILIYGEDRTPVYEIHATKDELVVKYAEEKDYLLCLVGDLVSSKKQKGDKIIWGQSESPSTSRSPSD